MKSTFKRSKLAAAVMAATSAVVMSTASHAVNLSDNGLGEVGVVPYYTVRNNYDTYIHVVNVSNDYTVAFKLRFHEGDNSRDARDFNVFLSPNDVWTAVVTMSGDGATPLLQTADNSCTAPQLSPAVATNAGMRGVRFTTIGFDGTSPVFPADPGPRSIERTQEGWVEVIEMGVADPGESQLAAYAVHDASGQPANCQAISATYLNSGIQPFHDQFDEPLNLLKVDAYLLSTDRGVGANLPVSTLANFFNPNGTDNPEDPAPQDLMEQPPLPIPNLNSGDPVADQVVEVLGAISDAGFSRGVDAVSSLFTATAVLNEYAIGGAANALNDWVITFPTKRFYVDTTDGYTQINPFEEPFQSPGVSCVEVVYNYFNREEKSIVPVEFCEEFPDAPQCILNFSPLPPSVTPPLDIAQICQEAQTLSFGEESVLGSANDYGVPLADGFTSGWMRLRFPNTEPENPEHTVPIQGEYTYWGLPTIGFSIKTLENGVSSTQGVLNYAISQPHAYNRDVED